MFIWLWHRVLAQTGSEASVSEEAEENSNSDGEY